MNEGHGPEAGAGGCAGAGLTKGRLGCPQEDPQQGRERLGTVAQKPAQALGKGQHPLANRHPGNHGVGKMGRRLGHAARVAARTQAAGAAAEGDQEVVTAAGATGACEALGQDAAVQVFSEGPFHVGGDRSKARIPLP